MYSGWPNHQVSPDSLQNIARDINLNLAKNTGLGED